MPAELSFDAAAAPSEAAADAPTDLSFEASVPAPEAAGSETTAGLGFDVTGAVPGQPPDAPPAVDADLPHEMATGVPTDFPPPPPPPET